MIDVSPELLAFLKEEYDRCQDEQLEDERTTAIDRYNGKPYGDEEAGRSQVVSMDTAETTDYMVISIMRTIVSGDDVVEFDHENAELAHQATRTIKWLLMKKQDGYRAIHDWLKAGLLEKNAVAMAYPEPQPPRRRALEGVSAMALVVAEQQGIQITEAEQVGEGPEGPVFNVTAMEPQPPKFCVDAVPNEEFYCSPDARTITEAALKGRKRLRPVHELVAEGFDPDELAMAGDTDDNLLSQARDEDRHNDRGARRGSARMIWWHEDYLTFDGRFYYIRRDGSFNVFSIDEMEEPDEHPFEDWCPFPMQHRRIGQALADKVMPLERINTVVLRQSLDGIYLSNNPMVDVHEDSIGENTIEDLLSVRPGRIRRYKGTMGPPTSGQIRFDPTAGFSMLEYLDRKRETRTGITRLNMGLDERTHTDTAKGQDQLLDRGDQVEEYVARNFASPLARLFTKLAKLLKRYGQPLKVPIDGKYVMVDPTQWPDDMIAEPKLGLGSTRKEKRLMARREVVGMQAQAFEAGLRIVDEKKFYNSAKGIISDAGLGDVNEFFNDPDEMQPAEPKPDPEMAKVQAQIQLEQNKLQIKQTEMASKLQLQEAEAQARIQMLQAQGAAKAQIDAQKAMNDAQLAMARAQAEAQIAQQRMEIDAMLEAEKLRMEHARAANDERRRDGESAARMDKMRKGGSLAK